MLKLFLAVSACLLLATSHGAVTASYEEVAEEKEALRLLSNLTLDEKISLVHGVRGPYVGNVLGVPRLQIPPLNMNDGPQGFRGPHGTSTAWPCALSMAATFDRHMVYQWGKAMAQEFKAKGSNVFLGPGVNVARIPQNGRNFEYLSGEDPVLGAKLVAEEIRAIQDHHVIANVKHFVHNNQETNRLTVDQIVDERTHWELYMPPFAAAVEAGVLSVMCSYNKVNGKYACENEDTLHGDLKGILNFKGFVVSDWRATHSAAPAAKAGLDMEMPGSNYFGKTLKKAVQSGDLPMAVLDDMVHRILRALIKSGSMKHPPKGTVHTNTTSDEHNQLARELAAAGVVLLKNENDMLPLKCQRFLVFGDILGEGDGSGHVDPPYHISGFQGIQNKCGTDIFYSPTANPDYSKIDQVDRIVVFTSTTSNEGFDRKNLSFPVNELQVIDKVISMAAEKVIVVGTAPGAVLLPFADQVSALLLAFMPGQEGGNAIADVLFGDVNPSGRLPVTIPNKENEMGMTAKQYPGVDLKATYSEKLLTGYRWYNVHNVKPKFAFGFGLSYTTFTYSDLQLEKDDRYSFLLTNTGNVDGFEVCQVYVWFQLGIGEPQRLLKNFQKVFLKAGQSKRLYPFGLSQQDLSRWNVQSHGWDPVKGMITVTVGPSSDNQPLQGALSNVNTNAAAA